MSLQQNKIFKFFVLGFLGLSLTIYLFAAHEEVLYLYDGASTYEKDGLQLSNFKIIGPSPWKAGDTVIVEFDLKNITGKPIYFGKRGIFVGCLNPNGNKENFGHQYSKFIVGQGKSVHVKAVKKLDKKGKWTFWPSYFLGSTRLTNHRRGYGPYKWKAALIKPSTKPIKKFKTAITRVIKPVQVTRDKQVQMEQDGIVCANQDALLMKYETGDRKFIKNKIGDYMVYRHMRKIGEAIVERDVIRYKFDWKTKKLLDKKTQWRRDLPGQIPPVIAKSQAEALVEGKVLFSKLYFISPTSRVFRIKPVPRDPCWIVSGNVNGSRVISIINAVTGEFLGFGEPPPAVTGYSLIGPSNWLHCYNEHQSWYELRDNAVEWFVRMGYTTPAYKFPDERFIEGFISHWEIALFYEIAHSGTSHDEGISTSFLGSCHPERVTAMDVRNWLSHSPKMPFAFLSSCSSMCDTEGANTLSYSFRKGSNRGTVTVGCCEMSEPHCSSAWSSYFDWQDDFFTHLSQGDPVGQAFDDAMINYSECAGCIRLAGDKTLKLVPAISRNPAPIIAYWPIQERSGRSVFDRTPRQRQGTINGAVRTQGISGPGAIMRNWDIALEFDGSSGFIEVDYDAAFNLTNFTLEAWVRFTNSSQRAGIISRPSDGDPTHGHSFFRMSTNHGRISGGVQGEGQNYSASISSNDNFADDVWHKCTFVRNVDTNTIEIYVDGQLQGAHPNASPGNMNHNRKGLFIGSYQHNRGFFKGKICSVKIWGKALNEDEIQDSFIWEADEDGDGIVFQIDPAPGEYSNSFKNGSTTGSIIDRGDQVLILIPKSGGVLVKADEAGGTTPATIRLDDNNVSYTLSQGNEILLHQEAVRE